MNRLSVVIITMNEERNIRRCLDSVMPVADEIIVVDSHSTDATPAICSNYPVRFVTHDWEGYIGSKNFGNTLATNNLVLSIDGDEALSPELAESILRIKSEVVSDQVFSMNRLMNYCGQWIHHGGWYPDTKIRIFNPREVKWTGQKVHETLDLPKETQVVHLQGDLYHYSFYTPEEHRRQMERFAVLSAEEMAARGKRPSLFSAGLHTGWKFLRDYVFKTGFLDGKMGLTISKINAYGVWLKYRIRP